MTSWRSPSVPGFADPTRWLTDADLDFLVRAASTRRTDFERIRELIRDKPDILDVMLDDERVYRRMASDDEILLKVSPRLLFTVLLRRVRRLLKESYFTVEGGPSGRLPVFDARQAARLVEQPPVLGYLADMLASFVRTEPRAVVFRRGQTYHRKVFSDIDVDDLMTLAELVDPAERFALYKRVADLCLFLLGMFPEHIDRSAARAGRNPWDQTRIRLRGRLRDRADYERIGQEFYQRAAQDEAAARMGLAEVMSTIADHFILATKPLNVLAGQVIPLRRLAWFAPAGPGPGAPGGAR